jgi:hypothetical protein
MVSRKKGERKAKERRKKDGHWLISPIYPTAQMAARSPLPLPLPLAPEPINPLGSI